MHLLATSPPSSARRSSFNSRSHQQERNSGDYMMTLDDFVDVVSDSATLVVKVFRKMPSNMASLPMIIASPSPSQLLMPQALNNDLVVPEFSEMIDEVTRIFEDTRSNRSGNIADYIPELASVDPGMMKSQRLSHRNIIRARDVLITLYLLYR